MAKNEDILVQCGVCCGVLTILAGIISFMTFGIIFLVQDWDTYRDCSGSALGPYVIVALVLTWGNGNAAKRKDDDDTVQICVSVLFLILLNIGLAIWGGFELWEKSCPDLKDTNLWSFSLAVFIIQVFTAVILMLLPLIVICIASIKSNSSSNVPPTEDSNVPPTESSINYFDKNRINTAYPSTLSTPYALNFGGNNAYPPTQQNTTDSIGVNNV